jgi:hypothetical protein
VRELTIMLRATRRPLSTVAFSLFAGCAVVVLGCAFNPQSGPASGAAGTGSGPAPTGASGTIGTGTGAGLQTGSAGTAGGPSTGTSNPDANCGAVSRGAAKLPPDILIVLDKSGSMADTPDGKSNGGANSKWSQVTAAISQVVTSTSSSVNWGLKFFASPNKDACTVAAGADVPIAPNNAAAVNSAIQGQSPGSSTPTRVAENEGAKYLASLTDNNPRYLLLATDGLPNCPPGCSGNNCTTTPNKSENAAAAQAVTDAANMGFKTFVVGIATSGDATANATLSTMATNGGVPRAATPPYYPVSSTNDLVTALQAIVGVAATCKFDLGAPPNGSTSTSFIDVFGDGVKIPQDPTHASGWDYTDASKTAIQVYGPTCDAIVAGTIKDVTVTFRCIVG